MMENSYKPEHYWNERFRIHGHTGWSDEAIYAYDQPLRLKAISKALARAKVYVSNTARVLDVGCGTGDLILEFAKKGTNVTGIDVSNEVIEYAKKRFSSFKNVELVVGRIEEADFASNFFDLVTSVTVLQHITEQQAFSEAIRNIIRMTKANGHVLILETLPINMKSLRPSPYQAIRTRREWINAFERDGCLLIYDMGVPQLSIRLLQAYDKVLWLLLRPIVRTQRRRKSAKGRDTRVATLTHNSQAARRRAVSLLNLPKRTMLKMTKPFDSLLIPFPGNFTTLRIVVFRKVEPGKS